jgi:transcriptional regulator with XRE-family HTH domain
MSIKLNIKTLRTQAGLTQQKLAELSGLATTQISSLENNDANPSIETITRIARALNVSILHIVDDVIETKENRIKEPPANYNPNLSQIIVLLKKHPKAVKLILNELSFIDQSNELVSLENILSAIMQLTPDKRKALLALLG